MPALLSRSQLNFDAKQGLFFGEHFQAAYATNDIERACHILRQRCGIRDFARLEGALPAGGHIRVELAWVGTIMYELMTATGPGSEIYVGRLPQGGDFALKHHHLGYLVHDEGQWDALMEGIERSGWAMPHFSDTPGFTKSCFVDATELGHYLEYILPAPAGLAFFEGVPRH